MPVKQRAKWGLVAVMVCGASYYVLDVEFGGDGTDEAALGVAETSVVANSQVQVHGTQKASPPNEGWAIGVARLSNEESGAQARQQGMPMGRSSLQSSSSQEAASSEGILVPPDSSEDIFMSVDASGELTASDNDDEPVNIGESLDPDAESSWRTSSIDGAPVEEVGQFLDPDGDAWMFGTSAANVEASYVGTMLDPDDKEAIIFSQGPSEEVVNIGKLTDPDMPR